LPFLIWLTWFIGFSLFVIGVFVFCNDQVRMEVVKHFLVSTTVSKCLYYDIPKKSSNQFAKSRSIDEPYLPDIFGFDADTRVKRDPKKRCYSLMDTKYHANLLQYDTFQIQARVWCPKKGGWQSHKLKSACGAEFFTKMGIKSIAF